MKNAHRIMVGKPEEKRPLEDLDVNVNTILKWILRKSGGRVWTGLIWLRIGTGGGLL
jgi:hypothetical protein